MSQLKDQKLDLFFMRSFEDSRMILFPRITLNNPRYKSIEVANKNIALDQPKLMEFFK